MASSFLDRFATTSFWQQSIGLPTPEAPAGEGLKIETDLCIVGGGVIGSSIAWFAKQAGIEAVLLDARQPALGATGRNAGMALCGIAESYASAVEQYGRQAAKELWQLTIDNREMMLGLAARLGVPSERCGSWLLADCAEEAEALAGSARLLQADGFDHHFASTDFFGRGFLAGLHRPADGVIQPAHFNRALLAASGVRVISSAAVTEINPAGTGLRVESSRATVHARRVLLATNGYSALFHPFFQGKVHPRRGQIQVSEPAPLVFPVAGYSHFGYYYFRQVAEPDQPGMGRWLIGGARHLNYATENHLTDENVTAKVQADISAYTARYFPELADVPISHRWAGTMGFTDDGLPLVGEMPDQPGVFFCVGFNGHGMGLGIKVAERAFGLLTEGRGAGMFDWQRLKR
ncbi:MAG: FAD-binding oxidoreductase [Caldilineaceae bacterium]